MDELDIMAPSTNLLAPATSGWNDFSKTHGLSISLSGKILKYLFVSMACMSQTALCPQPSKQSLQQVGLWNEVKDRLDHPAQALSGGQQQRSMFGSSVSVIA